MAHFAKHIESKTRDRLQRHVGTLPNLSGTVMQKETGYFFSGTVRKKPTIGRQLGKTYTEARAALEVLNG